MSGEGSDNPKGENGFAKNVEQGFIPDSPHYGSVGGAGAGGPLDNVGSGASAKLLGAAEGNAAKPGSSVTGKGASGAAEAVANESNVSGAPNVQ